jgi:hypothetical protein
VSNTAGPHDLVLPLRPVTELRLAHAAEGAAVGRPVEGRLAGGQEAEQEARRRPVGLDVEVAHLAAEEVAHELVARRDDEVLRLSRLAQGVEAEAGREIRQPLGESLVEPAATEDAVAQLVVVQHARDGGADGALADADQLAAGESAAEVEGLLVVDADAFVVQGEQLGGQVRLVDVGKVEERAFLVLDRVYEHLGADEEEVA